MRGGLARDADLCVARKIAAVERLGQALSELEGQMIAASGSAQRPNGFEAGLQFIEALRRLDPAIATLGCSLERSRRNAAIVDWRMRRLQWVRFEFDRSGIIILAVEFGGFVGSENADRLDQLISSASP